MAMEDAMVLAEVLNKAHDLDSALKAYVSRRRPRADWVQEQSRPATRAFVLSPAIRDAALRERGIRRSATGTGRSSQRHSRLPAAAHRLLADYNEQTQAVHQHSRSRQNHRRCQIKRGHQALDSIH